jgi:hypothetical protein
MCLRWPAKPLLGIVPAWQVEKLSQRREEILALLEQSWARNRTVGEAEVKQTVKEAIEEVRREKAQSRPRAGFQGLISIS